MSAYVDVDFPPAARGGGVETGPAASLSNTHVPFSFSGVVGHARCNGKRNKKKEKEYTYT